MAELAITHPRRGIYDGDICAFPWQFRGTGPQVTSIFECGSTTSVHAIANQSESRQSVEKLAEIERDDTTDAAIYSASEVFSDSRDQTGTLARGNLILALESLIRKGALSEFVARLESIDWATRRPEELGAAIDLALREEMTALAIELAQLGKRLYPHHERIQRAARVLAPPIARPTRLPPAQGLKASRQWLREHASEYRGRWVAVRDGELLGAASSMSELDTVIDRGEDALDILVTKVL